MRCLSCLEAQGSVPQQEQVQARECVDCMLATIQYETGPRYKKSIRLLRSSVQGLQQAFVELDNPLQELKE